MHQPYRGIHTADDDDVTREKMGTLAYAAPEVRLGLPYSYEVDFWSLGVLFYVMLTGRVSQLLSRIMITYQSSHL